MAEHSFSGNDDPRVASRALSLHNSVSDTALTHELKCQRIILILLGLCVLMLTAALLFVILYPNKVPWRKPTTYRTYAPVTLSEDEKDAIAVKPIEYKEAGYQCAAPYTEVAELHAVEYCKFFSMPLGFFYMFKPYRIFFGKHFVGNSTCYVLEETEIEMAPPRSDLLHLKTEFVQYLEVRGEKTRYITTEAFHEGDPCEPVKFRHYRWLTLSDPLTGGEILLRDFLLARVSDYSDDCKQKHLVPALYSERVRKCFYGVGPEEPVRVASDCHILCDGGPLAKLPEWTSTNLRK